MSCCLQHLLHVSKASVYSTRFKSHVIVLQLQLVLCFVFLVQWLRDRNTQSSQMSRNITNIPQNSFLLCVCAFPLYQSNCFRKLERNMLKLEDGLIPRSLDRGKIPKSTIILFFYKPVNFQNLENLPAVWGEVQKFRSAFSSFIKFYGYYALILTILVKKPNSKLVTNDELFLPGLKLLLHNNQSPVLNIIIEVNSCFLT